MTALGKSGNVSLASEIFATLFDVSRMTVRQAITLLVDEGILERKPGSGTFVASSRVKEKMRGTTSFTEIVKSQGKKPSSELISYKRVHPNEFEIKNLGCFTTVLCDSYGTCSLCG